MTNTTTKIAIASLLAVTLTSSAFADSLYDRNRDELTNARNVQTTTAASVSTNGYEAYAQAPSQQRQYGLSAAERRAFDRATEVSLAR